MTFGGECFDEKKVADEIARCLKEWDDRDEDTVGISFGYSRRWGNENERRVVDESLRRVSTRMRYG